MRLQVATWNMQGDSKDKRQEVIRLAQTAKVVCLQEAGALADEDDLGGLYVVGLSGKNSEGYYNNRVSLAIVSQSKPDAAGFQPADDRGILWAVIGGILYGTWHEKQGKGGLGTCLQSLFMAEKKLKELPLIIGGDFNSEKYPVIKVGRTATLHSSDYNWAYRGSTIFGFNYSGTFTHYSSTQKKYRNLDRIYVSQDFQIVHQWSVPLPKSDHNPVLAELVTDDKDLDWWERLKGGGE